LGSSGLGGKGWGYEAIVRMNSGFELIWCDFESPSLRLVSNLDVSAPTVCDSVKAQGENLQRPWVQPPIQSGTQARLGVEDEGPHCPGMSDAEEPFLHTSAWFWFSAAAKTYTGDSRIRLNSGGIFSFYEPGLQNQSHVRVAEDMERFGLRSGGRWKSTPFPRRTERDEMLRELQRRRSHHRLTSVEGQDARYMRKAIEQRLRHSLEVKHDGSTIDWAYVSKDIVTRYSAELKTLLAYLTNDIPDTDQDQASLQAWLAALRQLTHWFLLPFFEYPTPQPYEEDALADLFGTRSPLSQTTLERCVSQYALDEALSDDDDTIFAHAITETLHGFCSTVVQIALHVEYHWFLYFQPSDPSKPHKPLLPHTLKNRALRWKLDLQELIAWLGWAEQNAGCKEKCGVGEYCYLPMWPVRGWDKRDGQSWNEESRFLWEGVCVGMKRYPPERWKE
jgi:hypothetical protein